MRFEYRLALCLLIGGVTSVAGQEEGRAPVAMREAVYEKLSRAQEAIQAEKWADAAGALESVKKMRNLDSNEAAQLYTAYGYFYFAQDKYRESIDAYETVLQQENLSEALMATTLYALAQLQFHVDDYGKAAGYLERWLTAAINPAPDPFVLLGQAYYQLGRHREAAAQVERALDVARERGVAARENWYGLLRAFYFELEDYPKLLDVLEVLVSRFPRKEYWLHLAAAYGELGNDERRLAAYEVAYARGYLTNGPELITLSQLLMQAAVPYRAGLILSKGMGDGLIEGTIDNWRLLSQAWILAHEHARAIEALTKAAGLSSDGELDARLAQAHANLDEWENTVAAARVALQKGVDNAHELHVLIGMALFELDRLDDAKRAFRDALESPEGRTTATQWITFIEGEKERLRRLESSLK